MALQKGYFGEEGKVLFKNTRTSLTFDSADVVFASGKISFPQAPLYITGTIVQLSVDPASGSGLPAPLAIETDYYVIIDSADTTGKTIRLAATEANALAGTSIALTDAGTGTAHGIALSEYELLATAQNWTINPTKASVDATTLGQSVRSYRGGLVDASGSMTVIYEASDELAAKKARNIFTSFFLAYDDGDMELELYLSTVETSGVDNKISCTAMVESASLSANIGQLITASVNFKVNGRLDFSGAI